MAKLLTAHIQIEPLKPFSFAHEIAVTSSFKNLTDTCTLRFPRNLRFKGNLRQALRLGDSAQISTGYDGLNRLIFEGYLSSIKPQTPFTLEMEDEMWRLKQTTFSGAYSSVSLQQLLSDMLTPKGVDFHAPQSIHLGKRRFEKMTIAKVLERLKEEYGVFSFFVRKKLYVGTPYLLGFQYAESRLPLRFHFQSNIIREETTLEYVSQEDRKIKVEAISILGNNKTLKATIGDADGETHTLHYYGIESEAELKQHAEADYARMCVAGYKGHFATYGNANVAHGMVVSLADNEYPEREGNYLVEAVETTWGIGGYRQKITIGTQISL